MPHYVLIRFRNGIRHLYRLCSPFASYATDMIFLLRQSRPRELNCAGGFSFARLLTVGIARAKSSGDFLFCAMWPSPIYGLGAEDMHPHSKGEPENE